MSERNKIEWGKYADSIQYANGCSGAYDHLTGPWIQVVDEQLIANPAYRGVNHYELYWNLPGRDYPDPEIGKPPHEHREDELIFLFGGDHDHSQELGATVEICLGEEMERHVIEHPCCICIPAGTIHGLFRIVETRKPWCILRASQSPRQTEHFHFECIPEELLPRFKNREIWQDKNWD